MLPRHTICKRFDFCASHVLDGMPEGHQCGRLHGHNYAVEVELTGWPDDRGIVFDYGDLAPIRSWLEMAVEHRHLNDVLPAGTNPTAENLAKFFLDEWTPLWAEVSTVHAVTVRVSETPKTWATYGPVYR